MPSFSHTRNFNAYSLFFLPVSRIKRALSLIHILSDKMSTDDNARELRRNILKQYYPLYKAVYYKEYHSTEETPIEIDLFLRYGFLSETLLTEELLEELLSLDNDRSGRGDCRVYDMKEWLTEVYEMCIRDRQYIDPSEVCSVEE